MNNNDYKGYQFTSIIIVMIINDVCIYNQWHSVQSLSHQIEIDDELSDHWKLNSGNNLNKQNKTREKKKKNDKIMAFKMRKKFFN